MGTINRTVTRN